MDAVSQLDIGDAGNLALVNTWQSMSAANTRTMREHRSNTTVKSQQSLDRAGHDLGWWTSLCYDRQLHATSSLPFQPPFSNLLAIDDATPCS